MNNDTKLIWEAYLQHDENAEGQTVYVVVQDLGYDGQNVLGVFSSLDEAESKMIEWARDEGSHAFDYDYFAYEMAAGAVYSYDDAPTHKLELKEPNTKPRYGKPWENQDPLGGEGPRITKSGKINKQDERQRIKEGPRLGRNDSRLRGTGLPKKPLP